MLQFIGQVLYNLFYSSDNTSSDYYSCLSSSMRPYIIALLMVFLVLSNPHLNSSMTCISLSVTEDSWYMMCFICPGLNPAPCSIALTRRIPFFGIVCSQLLVWFWYIMSVCSGFQSALHSLQIIFFDKTEYRQLPPQSGQTCRSIGIIYTPSMYCFMLAGILPPIANPTSFPWWFHAPT